MFESLKKANISVTAFAKVAGVSRVSVSQWVNGRMKPHKLHQAKINALMEAVDLGLEQGKFPIPKGLERNAAFRLLKATIVDNVREIRAGAATAAKAEE